MGVSKPHSFRASGKPKVPKNRGRLGVKKWLGQGQVQRHKGRGPEHRQELKAAGGEC